MIAEASDVAVWAHGVAAGAYALFALYLLRAWRGGRAGGALLAAVTVSMVWAACSALLAAWPGSLLLRLIGFIEVLRVLAWYAFLLVLLQPLWQAGRRWPLWVAGGVSAGMLAAVLAPALSVDQPTAVAKWPLAAFLAAAVFGLMLVEQVFRGLPRDSRWALKPLCLGLAASWMFELYFFADGFLFARLDPQVGSVRGLVHAMVMPLVALSAARNPSWTLRIAVSRTVVFHSTALAVAGAYLLVIAAAGYYVRYVGGDWGRALQTALLFAGLLMLGLLVGSGASRARLRVLVNKHLFPYRYDYRHEWLRFTQALSVADDGLELGQSVIKALSDLVESPGGVLWLRQADGHYRPHSRLNAPHCEAVEEESGSLCRFLAEREWVINLEEFRVRRSHYAGLALPAWLQQQEDAWLVLPLIADARLVGFVVLKTPRTPFEVDWEVLDLLKTAQRQAAGYLARMQVTEALIEARKFDAFNRMSAFVVHDLKNLVAQLSLMLKNAQRHRDNPQFQQDMLDTVAHVESRMRALMGQLQDKTPIDATRAVDLGALLQRIADNKRNQRPPVELAVPQRTAVTVLAHGERLERVLGHLVQNALDATPDDGKVIVQVHDPKDGAVTLEVSDTGCGMTPEFIRERLSRPFQTTKEGGMGLGVYETAQYIRELGGTIAYDSGKGCGTRVTVRLPVSGREPPDGDEPSGAQICSRTEPQPLRA
ncbi:PEP-CTERM system histidine kinase PrsK [Zoogloeaceae bacteirum Par-f-2]|nr:PEP-CTERM system histidine kinase PrsK [Zoogloeaceae bacteirum Par-f-2]